MLVNEKKPSLNLLELQGITDNPNKKFILQNKNLPKILKLIATKTLRDMGFEFTRLRD